MRARQSVETRYRAKPADSRLPLVNFGGLTHVSRREDNFLMIHRGEEEMLRALRQKKRWGVFTLGLVIAGASAPIALATPGFGVTTTTFVTAGFPNSVHFNSDRVKFQTKDPTTVRVQKLDWAAGAYSGWHHHP